MGDLVHPQHSTGRLNLPAAFIMDYSAILMHTAAVSHFVLSVPVGEAKMNVSGPSGGMHFMIPGFSA